VQGFANQGIPLNILQQSPERIEFHQEAVILFFADIFEHNEEEYIELEEITDIHGNEIDSGLRISEIQGDCGC